MLCTCIVTIKIPSTAHWYFHCYFWMHNARIVGKFELFVYIVRLPYVSSCKSDLTTWCNQSWGSDNITPTKALAFHAACRRIPGNNCGTETSLQITLWWPLPLHDNDPTLSLYLSVLILTMLKLFKETWKYVCIFHHFSYTEGNSLMNIFLTEDPFIRHYQCHCYWGPGDARSHGISNHGIDLFSPVSAPKGLTLGELGVLLYESMDSLNLFRLKMKILSNFHETTPKRKAPCILDDKSTSLVV